MGQSALYDDDILLWSEEQAELIRRLGRTRRDLPNELDVENVAEEIESVGRSELAAVESYLRLLMLHLIKIATTPTSPSVPHWRDEVRNFGAEAMTRFAPSMTQRLDIERAWRVARHQALQTLNDLGEHPPYLSEECPFSIDDLVRESLDLPFLLSRLLERMTMEAQPSSNGSSLKE